MSQNLEIFIDSLIFSMLGLFSFLFRELTFHWSFKFSSIPLLLDICFACLFKCSINTRALYVVWSFHIQCHRHYPTCILFHLVIIGFIDYIFLSALCCRWYSRFAEVCVCGWGSVDYVYNKTTQRIWQR